MSNCHAAFPLRNICQTFHSLKIVTTAGWLISQADNSRALHKREYLVNKYTMILCRINKKYPLFNKGYFLLILHKIMCCDPSSEPSRPDGSNEGSQHMISMRNTKNYPSIIIKYSPSSTARRDGSNEWSQYMVSMRNKKNHPSLTIKSSLLSRAL